MNDNKKERINRVIEVIKKGMWLRTGTLKLVSFQPTKKHEVSYTVMGTVYMVPISGLLVAAYQLDRSKGLRTMFNDIQVILNHEGFDNISGHVGLFGEFAFLAVPISLVVE